MPYNKLIFTGADTVPYSVRQWHTHYIYNPTTCKRETECSFAIND